MVWYGIYRKIPCVAYGGEKWPWYITFSFKLMFSYLNMMKNTYILFVKTTALCFLLSLYFSFGTFTLMTVLCDSSISYDACSFCLWAVFLKCLEEVVQKKYLSLGFLRETYNDNFVLSISLFLGSVVPQKPVHQCDMVHLPGLHRTLWDRSNTQ